MKKARNSISIKNSKIKFELGNKKITKNEHIVNTVCNGNNSVEDELEALCCEEETLHEGIHAKIDMVNRLKEEISDDENSLIELQERIDEIVSENPDFEIN